MWSMLLTAWLFISIFCFSYSAQVVGRIDLEAQESASSRADIAVQTVEQLTAGVIRVANIRHALAQSAINVSGKGDAPGASAIFSHIQHVVSSGFMGLYHISIIRNDGSLFWSSNSDLYERHSREISNALLSDTNTRRAQLFEIIGLIGDRDTLKISRMANTNSGEHFGVIISLFDKAHLADALRAMNVGPGAGALVMMRDGTIIAHSDPPGEITTSRLPPGNALTPALAQAPSGQFQIEESLYDGQPKLVAYRSLPDSPIVVAVAIDPAAELPGKATLRPLLMASAVGLSILALASISLVAVWHGRRRDQAALDAARRDREKAWEQLFHAQKAEALGRLAGGVAHDVNNVLQAVLGGAKAIKRRVPDPDIQRISNLIVEASERGASVTRRLLTLARRGELRPEPIDLGHVLLGLDEVLTHTLGADLLVRVEAPPALPPVLADKAQLETVLVNLSINARDAMASRSDGRLTLSAALETIGPQKAAEPGLKLGKYVAISVVDTGTGMDADTLRRATEPFFTTKPSGQGTGLGLAMAKAFAEQSGGAFRIVSEPGLGTTVTLLMPCAAIQAIPSVLANNEAPSDASEPKNSKLRRRALLVDDDSFVRQTLAGSLSDHGWSVDSVGSGAEALPVLERTEAIDLLVTDLAMPGMNGLDLIREARERRPGLPALLLTGYAGTAHAGLLGLAGAGGPFTLLRKPVRPEELLDAAEILVSPNGDGDLLPPERRP